MLRSMLCLECLHIVSHTESCPHLFQLMELPTEAGTTPDEITVDRARAAPMTWVLNRTLDRGMPPPKEAGLRALGKQKRMPDDTQGHARKRGVKRHTRGMVCRARILAHKAIDHS
jgi:hypothetical protein